MKISLSPWMSQLLLGEDLVSLGVYIVLQLVTVPSDNRNQLKAKFC